MPQQEALPQSVLDAMAEEEEESQSWDSSSDPEEPSRLQEWAGITDEDIAASREPTEFSGRSLLGGDLSWEEFSEGQTPVTMALLHELPWLLAGGAAAKGLQVAGKGGSMLLRRLGKWIETRRRTKSLAEGQASLARRQAEKAAGRTRHRPQSGPYSKVPREYDPRPLDPSRRKTFYGPDPSRPPLPYGKTSIDPPDWRLSMRLRRAGKFEEEWLDISKKMVRDYNWAARGFGRRGQFDKAAEMSSAAQRTMKGMAREAKDYATRKKNPGRWDFGTDWWE